MSEISFPRESNLNFKAMSSQKFLNLSESTTQQILNCPRRWPLMMPRTSKKKTTAPRFRKKLGKMRKMKTTPSL